MWILCGCADRCMRAPSDWGNRHIRLEPGQSRRKLEQQRQELPGGESQQELAGQPQHNLGFRLLSTRRRRSAQFTDCARVPTPCPGGSSCSGEEPDKQQQPVVFGRSPGARRPPQATSSNPFRQGIAAGDRTVLHPPRHQPLLSGASTIQTGNIRYKKILEGFPSSLTEVGRERHSCARLCAGGTPALPGCRQSAFEPVGITLRPLN